MAMKLLGDDHAVGLDVVRPECDLLVLHEKGWGKRTPLEEFNAKGATQGNWVTDHTRLDEIGPVVATRGSPARRSDHYHHEWHHHAHPVTGISQYGRMTRGVRIVSLKGDDTVAALAVMDHQDLQLTADGEAQSPAVGAQSMHDDGSLNQDLTALDGEAPEMDAENPEPEIVAE